LLVLAAVVVGVALAVPIFLFGVFLFSFSARWCLRELAPEIHQSRPFLDKALAGAGWVSALGFVVFALVLGAVVWFISHQPIGYP
jgi:hypothetical protein